MSRQVAHLAAFVISVGVGAVLVGGLGASGAQAAPPSHGNARFGQFLVWSRFDDFATGTARLVVADAQGDHVTPITNPPAGSQDIDPRISPDGRHILFERDDADGISTAGIVGTDGHGEALIDLGCTDPCAGTNTPTWTPDGRHLVYDRVSGPFDDAGDAASAVLWQANLNGTHQRRVSDPSLDSVRTEETDASFAPAGYRVVLRDTIDRQSAIFRERADGSHAVQLTPWELLADLPFVSPARFGPTKDLVVFEATGPATGPFAGGRIGTVPATCISLASCAAQIRYLTPSATETEANFNPSWSPDGQGVIYVNYRSGDDTHNAVGDIWTMRWDGAQKTPVSLDPRFEFRPVWGIVTNAR
jgi:Tol biopolymer transport system component